MSGLGNIYHQPSVTVRRVSAHKCVHQCVFVCVCICVLSTELQLRRQWCACIVVNSTKDKS